MLDLKIEKTPTEEKESFINMCKGNNTITITTHDPVVFKNLLKDLGKPT